MQIPPGSAKDSSGHHFPVAGQSANRCIIIFTHEATLACNISTKNRWKFPFEGLGAHRISSEKIKASERMREFLGGYEINTFSKTILIGSSRRLKVDGVF